MNQKQREHLKSVIEIIEDLKDIVSTEIENEQSKFDNLPEGLQESENGAKLNDAVLALEETLSNFEDAIGNIEEAML